MTKRFWLLIILFPVALDAAGQNTDLYKSLKMKYQDDPAVFVERGETVSILIKDDSLEITSDISEDMLYLKDQADAFASGRVYGSHFNQVKDIKAKTLIWDKSRFKEMNVSDFKKNSDRDAGVFYDDSYYYSFNYPSVAIGNRTQLQYRSVLKDPHFIPGYIFSTYLPQAKTIYTIRTSRAVELVYDVINDQDQHIKFRKFEKGGLQYYEWSATDLGPRKNDDSSPTIRYYAPHVICYVKSYETKTGKVNVLSDLGDLYKWYQGFVKDLDRENSPELTSIVEKIKVDYRTSSDRDVVKAVFYWVQDNIQYVAFEEGMRGLIPHNGQYVCAKRYGDCKDMANLIVALLKAANIKAYHTWIGTRDLPYKYTEVPTPLVDNHMIATYIDSNNQYYFLDATSDHTPFGLPSSMIQGKEALIGLGKDKYEIKVVPVIEKESNVMIDSVWIQLDENHGSQLTGTGTARFTGYAKVTGAYELDRSEKSDVRKYVTKVIGKGSNKFYLDSYNLLDVNERDKASVIKYSFRLGDYFQKTGNELYINLNLNKDLYNASINSGLRKTPKESEYRYEHKEFCSFLIPEGYDIEYMPADSKVGNDLLGIQTSYKREGNRVFFSKNLYSNYLMLMPKDFERWNEAIEQISVMYKESIILKKN